jgi:hypothetical protein
MMRHCATIEELGPKPVIQRTRKLFSILAAQERRVIACLRVILTPENQRREADRRFHAALPEGTRAAFVQLAAETRANDLVVFAPHSAFVSEDELAILSRLILLQRPTQSGQWRAANPFQKALKRCAAALEEEGRRLLPRVGLCDAYADRGGCFRIELTAHDAPSSIHPPPRRGSQYVWNGRHEPRPGTLKARALSIVREHRIARTSQFNAVGISNQYLSLLCKRGYVEKAGHGFYRLPRRFSKGVNEMT